MNPLLQRQMDAYALMKARQGIAREAALYFKLIRRYRQLAIENPTWESNQHVCEERIGELFELARNQFPQPRPKGAYYPEVDVVGIEEERADAWARSNFGRY